MVVEVDGKRIEVSLPNRFLSGSGKEATAGRAPKRRVSAHHAASGASDSVIKAPMQSTVVKIAVEAGQTIVEGDQLIVLEAMKMEQSINASRDGVIKSVSAKVGETIPAGTVLMEFED